MVNVVVVPLDIGFEIASYSWPFLSFLLLSDLLFLLDLVLGFFIAFTSKANELVTQARRRPQDAVEVGLRQAGRPRQPTRRRFRIDAQHRARYRCAHGGGGAGLSAAARRSRVHGTAMCAIGLSDAKMLGLWHLY